MVRNEEKIIERCLRAALPHVDALVLSVNGTTDATVEIASRVATELEKPFSIVESEWQNFGVNRSRSVTDTRAWCVAQGWDVSTTYALLLDADHVLHAASDRSGAHAVPEAPAVLRTAFVSRPSEQPFGEAAEPWLAAGALGVAGGGVSPPRVELVHPHYELDLFGGNQKNPGTRLICLSHEWKCIGVTHEYWASEPDTGSVHYAGLWVEDLYDGGAKADKHERDVKLLTEGLKAEQGNGRYMFYLGETYLNMGEPRKAFDWYEKRIAAGGWDEEIWYSRYKQGIALLRMSKTERAAGVLLQAFEMRPGRAEPLAVLARHYREKGQNQLAYMIALRGAEVPDSTDRLFVETDVQHRCFEEISITGFYCGDKSSARKVGFEACEHLLSEHGQSDHFYNHVACNESYYLTPHPALRRGVIPLPPTLLMADGLPYLGTNPTIVPVDDGHIVHVRLVNFEHTGGRNYRAFDPRGVFRTRGAMMRWDAEAGEARSEAIEVLQRMPADWPADVIITGLEDQRWVQHDGRVWFTATCCQVPGVGGRPRVVLGLMNHELDAVERVMSLDYEHTQHTEKNWVPWSLDGELLLNYSYEPFVVLRVDTETGKCEEKQRWMPPRRFARWRGGSSPVQITLPSGGSLWLLFTHEVAYRSTENIYAHRWAVIDSEKMEIVAYSKPFTFDHTGVEYGAGLVLLRQIGRAHV